jgi:hypothetical protein
VAEGGGLLNLRAPYPPVPFGLIVSVFVDVLAFGRFTFSRLSTLDTRPSGGNFGGKKPAGVKPGSYAARPAVLRSVRGGQLLH